MMFVYRNCRVIIAWICNIVVTLIPEFLVAALDLTFVTLLLPSSCNKKNALRGRTWNINPENWEQGNNKSIKSNRVESEMMMGWMEVGWIRMRRMTFVRV
jgi:hypothetical protein